MDQKRIIMKGFFFIIEESTIDSKKKMFQTLHYDRQIVTNYDRTFLERSHPIGIMRIMACVSV